MSQGAGACLPLYLSWYEASFRSVKAWFEIEMIKTKIIATIGPACNRTDTIKTMIDNGVDVFRLNFSHGTLDQHAEFLESLNSVRTEHLHTTAVIGDLCGP